MFVVGCGSTPPPDPDETQDHENLVAMAAVPLSKELKRASADTHALAKTSRDMRAALQGFVGYLDAHPADRTLDFARMVIAADKLIKNVDHLCALLDTHGDGGEIHIVAIDALHRLNEYVYAHQRMPALPELAYPDALIERFVAMLERVGRDAQANQADCAKLGVALAAHLSEDADLTHEMQKIDDARPQDQREAERGVPRPAFAARYQQAIAQRAPLNACKAEPRVAAYLANVEFQR